MKPEIRRFIRDYVRAIKESNAAIFAGAGLSKPAGYVNWKELLKDIAEDLGLDIDRETDLVSVAQYHVNDHGRGKINQLLLDEFTRDATITRNHQILAKLPIQTYWTTNYDPMIERALEWADKRADVKRAPQNLTTTLQNRDAVIYKMHGDYTQVEDAVLTKDDYENYPNTKRQLYTVSLQGDLVQKTFLFIGFSFDDPNLQYVLSRIRILLDQDRRQHFCFMKNVERHDFDEGDDGEKDYLYAQVKQDLRVKDLRRYGIKVILLDSYGQITEILQAIRDILQRENVFISGSASDFGSWGQERVFSFAQSLSKSLIKEEMNIVTGFGLGVGSCVISGALEEIFELRRTRVEDRLHLRPFPQTTAGTVPLTQIWTNYRRDMLEKVGVSVFMFGNKHDKESGELITANGMFEEFEIAVENGVVPVPIGATGYATKEIWDRVMRDFDRFVPDESLRPLYEFIGDEGNSDKEIISTVIDIINKLHSWGGV